MPLGKSFPPRVCFIFLFVVWARSLGMTAEGSAVEVSPVVPTMIVGSDPVALTSWLLYGPFYKEKGAFGYDFLAGNNATEESIGLSSFSNLRTTRLGVNNESDEQPTLRQINANKIVNLLQIYGIQAGLGAPEGAAYLACDLVSDAERSVYLLTGSDDSLKIWLNGQQIFKTDVSGGRPLHMFDEATQLSLRRGQNFLLVKVQNYGGAWLFAGRLEPTASAAAVTALESGDGFLKQPVLAVGEPLQISLRGGPRDLIFETKVEASNGQAVTSSALGKPDLRLDIPEPGLYRASIDFNGRTYTEDFTVGDPLDLCAMYMQRVSNMAIPEEANLYFGTLKKRIETLCRRNNRLPLDMNWRRKVVHTIGLLDDATRKLAAATIPFKHSAGLDFGAFVSRIDDSLQCYRLFTPRPENDNRGLIVILPVTYEVSRPYIESAQIADHITAEMLCKAAERSGVSLLWSGYRCRPYGSPCEFTHFDEVLAAVSKEHQFDPDRVSLLGICSSGMTASMMAVRWPERFAAIGLINPILHRLANRWDENHLFDGNPHYREWLRINDPVEPLASSRTPTPIWIVQNMDDPVHGPKWHADDFVRIATSFGYPIRYDVELDPYHEDPNVTWRDRMIPWLAKQHRAHASSKPVDVFGGHTPVSAVLARPFIIVEGTRGSAGQRESVRNLSRSFQEQWKRTQFSECRVTTDSALTDEQEKGLDLVLLGNASINNTWERLLGKDAVQLETTLIGLDNKRWEGSDLWIQAVLPHPKYKQRMIVVIGCGDIEHSVHPPLDLSIDGWFEYAIWRSRRSSQQLVDAGFLLHE